jgi:hypothetical protein
LATATLCHRPFGGAASGAVGGWETVDQQSYLISRGGTGPATATSPAEPTYLADASHPSTTRKTTIGPGLPPAHQKRSAPVVFAAGARLFRRASNNFIPLAHISFGAPATSLGRVREEESYVQFRKK